MERISIAYKSSAIDFVRFGTGKSVIICLHGFGEDAKSFAVLERYLENKFSLICIDLLFHGSTQWNEELTLEPEELITIITSALTFFGFENVQKFSLCGYSMGGRIAVDLLQRIPEKIEQAVLIAPDGLHANFWYWLATQTWLGNKLFKMTMHNPKWFLYIASFGQSIGLLNKSIIKFVHYYLDDKDVRLLLYKRWTTLRKFKPESNLFRKVIKKYSIPVRFVFGSYDRIILSIRADKFKKGLPTVKVLILNAGHQLLKEKHAKEIAQQFSE